MRTAGTLNGLPRRVRQPRSVSHDASAALPSTRSRIAREDLGHDRRLDGVGEQEAPLGVEAVAERDGAAGPLAARRLALHAGDRALDDRRSLELGEHAEHLDHHPPGRACGVERLGRRPEQDARLVEALEDLREPPDGAREAVDAVDEQEVEALGVGLAQSALEPGRSSTAPEAWSEKRRAIRHPS